MVIIMSYSVVITEPEDGLGSSVFAKYQNDYFPQAAMPCSPQHFIPNIQLESNS